MWRLYDTLIGDIPDGYPIDRVICGRDWTMVRSGALCGVAMSLEGCRPPEEPTDLPGVPLREAAQLVKSWNFAQASVGLAAINAWHNRADRLPGDALCEESRRALNPFTLYYDRLAGRRVAVVGHFPNLERLAGHCALSVLERRPRYGDYPDPACEYLLPEQDFVFITGSALANKTLPRLLALCAGAHTVLVGPSATLSPALFGFGADNLSGFVVTDPALCARIVSGALGRTIFDAGCAVSWSRPGGGHREGNLKPEVSAE